MTHDKATFTIVVEGDQYAIQQFEQSVMEMDTVHLDVEVTDCDVEEAVSSDSP